MTIRHAHLLLVLAAPLLGGCVNALVMDTGKSLSAGEMTTTAGFGAGWQDSEITSYVRREAEPPDDISGTPGRPEERVAFPLEPFQAEWFYRWSRGTGAGFQFDWAITMPTPVGLGGTFGMKWEVPIPGEFFAASVVGRAALNLSGNESAGSGGVVVAGAADPGLILSVHPTAYHALYVSPRARWDIVYSRLWSSSSARGYSGRALSWSGAAGWKFAWGDVAYIIEAAGIYTPQSRVDDGVRLLFGLSRVERF